MKYLIIKSDNKEMRVAFFRNKVGGKRKKAQLATDRIEEKKNSNENQSMAHKTRLTYLLALIIIASK